MTVSWHVDDVKLFI